MKLLNIFPIALFLFVCAIPSHAEELLKCQGQMEGRQTTFQFADADRTSATAFLWAEFNDDALILKCKVAPAGSSVFWNCTDTHPVGDSFLRANVEHTPHGDWTSIYRVTKSGSDLLATLDCR
jgi:hypothetical protein